MSANRDLDHLAGQITAAVPSLDPTEQQIGITLLRLLANGEPVDAARLADAVELPADRVDEMLDQWWGVYRDEQRRVVGWGGLTPLEMGDHRIHLEGRTLSAWCALDTLFLPELLDQSARVTSRDPATGDEISLTVTRNGPADVSPDSTVVSLLAPAEGFKTDVIKSFCHYVHFFTTPETAATWTVEHPGTFTVSIQDAYELGRTMNRTVFGAVFGGARQTA
jgi:alkylmercury lyase